MAPTTVTAAPVAPTQDQFSRRPLSELAAMCRHRGRRVNDADNAPALRHRLRNDVAERRSDNDHRFVTPPSTADRDTTARMELIDGEVRDHFATDSTLS